MANGPFDAIIASVSRREFKSTRALLPALLGKLSQQSGSAAALNPLWAEVAGPIIARHARPVAWEGPDLVLQVTEARWVQELQQQESALLERLRERLGMPGPQRLVFRQAR